MLWYFIFAGLLFILNVMENGGRRQAGVLAAILLAAVAGLRYETGYDWVEYEYLFSWAPVFGVDDIRGYVTHIEVEAGWELLSSIVKTLGLGFQSFLLIVAAFNFLILYKFTKKYSNFIVIVLIWYYGFSFLTGQMAAIRSCLGISFVLWGFMLMDRGKMVPAFSAAVASIFFHAFSAVLVPFVLLRRRLPAVSLVAALTLPSLMLVALTNISFFALVVQSLGGFLPSGLVTAKLELYSSSSGARLSPLLAVLVGWHFFAYFLIAAGAKEHPERRVLRFAGWITILNIVAHCYFPDYPVFWNRVMLVSFFLQAVALANIYDELLQDAGARATVGAAVTIVSCASLLYTLSTSQALAFKPYQSTLIVLMRGDYGDGRVRYTVVRQEIDTAAAEARRTAGGN